MRYIIGALQMITIIVWGLALILAFSHENTDIIVGMVMMLTAVWIITMSLMAYNEKSNKNRQK